MNLRAPAAALAVLVLAACSATPTTTPTAQPTTSPVPTMSSGTTWAPTPTLAPTPTVEPTAPPTAEPTAAPTVGPTSTPATSWTGPELVIPGAFDDTAILVDASGAAHVAAAGSVVDNKGIWYLTNASGTWTSERVSTAPPVEGFEGLEYDGEPSIAMDSDGSTWIAFTRWACDECAPNPSDGIFLVTNAGDTWSEPVQMAGNQTSQPSLVARDGATYLAYAEGMVPGLRSFPVWYRTDSSLVRVARNGSNPQLWLDSNGSPRILFAAAGIRRAIEDTGTFYLESLPGSNGGMSPRYAFDPVTSSPAAAWSAWSSDQQHINVMYSGSQFGIWPDPTIAIPDGDVIGLGIYNGVVHLIAVKADPEDWGGLLYATNAGGDFAVSTLHGSGGMNSALAVDSTGRPHIVFTVEDPAGKRGIWYGMGPTV